MKKSKLIVVLIIIVILIAILFLLFSKNTAKVFKNGNTKTSQEIVDYILNISSYKLKVAVEVNSNKNSNKWRTMCRENYSNELDSKCIYPKRI